MMELGIRTSFLFFFFLSVFLCYYICYLELWTCTSCHVARTFQFFMAHHKYIVKLVWRSGRALYLSSLNNHRLNMKNWLNFESIGTIQCRFKVSYKKCTQWKHPPEVCDKWKRPRYVEQDHCETALSPLYLMSGLSIDFQIVMSRPSYPNAKWCS